MIFLVDPFKDPDNFPQQVETQKNGMHSWFALHVLSSSIEITIYILHRLFAFHVLSLTDKTEKNGIHSLFHFMFCP